MNSPLISKLYQLINNLEFNSFITWNESGDTFVIPNTTAFAENILSKHFMKPSYASFEESLLNHGFQKKRLESSEVVFSHPNFRRNCKVLLSKIKVIKKDERKLSKRGDGTQTLKTAGIVTNKSSISLSNEMSSSQHMLSQLKNCMGELEANIQEMQTEVAQQQENIHKFEQEMKDYKEKTDQTFETLQRAIHLRRKYLEANLMNSRVNPILMKTMYAKPLSLKQQNLWINPSNKPKIAISVQQKYNSGFQHPDQYPTHSIRNRFQCNLGGISPRKLVKKEERPQIFLESLQTKPCSMPSLSEGGFNLTIKGLSFPVQSNLIDAHLVSLQSQGNQILFSKPFFNPTAENCIKKEETESKENHSHQEEKGL